MPINSNRPGGISLRENIITSGGEQFWLNTTTLGPPLQVFISAANLTSGAGQFPGVTGYESQNSTLGTWTDGALNYIWFRRSAVAAGPWFGIESDVGGFPDDSDIVPLWILDINGAGALNSVIDRRPWFDGGGSGDTTSMAERLKEVLQHRRHGGLPLRGSLHDRRC